MCTDLAVLPVHSLIVFGFVLATLAFGLFIY